MGATFGSVSHVYRWNINDSQVWTTNTSFGRFHYHNFCTSWVVPGQLAHAQKVCTEQNSFPDHFKCNLCKVLEITAFPCSASSYAGKVQFLGVFLTGQRVEAQKIKNISCHVSSSSSLSTPQNYLKLLSPSPFFTFLYVLTSSTSKYRCPCWVNV